MCILYMYISVFWIVHVTLKPPNFYKFSTRLNKIFYLVFKHIYISNIAASSIHTRKTGKLWVCKVLPKSVNPLPIRKKMAESYPSFSYIWSYWSAFIELPLWPNLTCEITYIYFGLCKPYKNSLKFGQRAHENSYLQR